MNVLTNVSSRVTVMGSEMISVSVAVAVGATVLKIVMKPEEAVDELSGGAPPEGSTTMVPGRLESGIVISPSLAVTVMMPPPVASVVPEVRVLFGGGVAVADADTDADAVAVPLNALVADAENVSVEDAVAESEGSVVAESDREAEVALLEGFPCPERRSAGGGLEG